MGPQILKKNNIIITCNVIIIHVRVSFGLTSASMKSSGFWPENPVFESRDDLKVEGVHPKREGKREHETVHSFVDRCKQA